MRRRRWSLIFNCGPQQVKPLVKDSGCSAVADPNNALADLKGIRARSTTDPSLEFGIMLDEPPPDRKPDNNHDHDSDADTEHERDACMLPRAMPLLYQDMQPSLPARCNPQVSAAEPEPIPGQKIDPCPDHKRACIPHSPA